MREEKNQDHRRGNRSLPLRIYGKGRDYYSWIKIRSVTVFICLQIQEGRKFNEPQGYNLTYICISVNWHKKRRNTSSPYWVLLRFDVNEFQEFTFNNNNNCLTCRLINVNRYRVESLNLTESQFQHIAHCVVVSLTRVDTVSQHLNW